MKRLKKELSLLLVIAFVISSMTFGIWQIKAQAYTDASGNGVFRVDIGIGANDCANGSRGTDSSFRLQFLNASGGVVCATPDNALNGGTSAGNGGANTLESGQTTSFTFKVATYGDVNETVPSLGTLAVNKTITQVQLVNTLWSDDWLFDNVVIYYSYDGGTNWWTLANNGWTGSVAGAVATWSVGTNFTGNAKTLTFNPNGGSGGAVYDAIPGQTIAALGGTPTRTGYTFMGWLGVPERMPNETATYFAVWSVNYYDVIYNGNGNTGGSTATSSHAYDVAKNLTANGFEKIGYTFAGWATSAGGDVVYVDQQSVTALSTDVDVNLYAKWTPNTYSVHYNGNGNTDGATGNSQHTYDAASPLTVNGFTRTGYSFAGWSLTEGGALVYNDAQIVTNLTATSGTVELYARWSVVTYYVAYDGNGGTGNPVMAPSTFTYGTSNTFKANTFIRTGYTFAGWATTVNGNVQYTNGQTLDANTNLTAINGATITMYAVWTANTYTVTYNINGGTGGATANSNHVYGTASNITTNGFTRTGYDFAGWATSAGGSVQYSNSQSVINLTPSGTFTLYAKWTAHTYTINYNGNGSTSGSMSDSVHTYDVAKNLTGNGYTKTGSSFLGWALTNSASTATWADRESVVNLTSINGAAVTFYAVWQVQYANITFDANGGTGSSGTIAMQVGAPLSPPVVSRTGYTLNETDYPTGWDPAVPSTVPATDTTYTAQWTANWYSIAFDAGGGAGGIPGTSMEYNTALSAPEVTWVGYTFTGWSPEVPATVPAAHQTYTAQWSINSYYLTFDAAGGTGGTGPALTQYGANIYAPAVAKTGYSFTGWSPALPTTMPAKDQTYTAIWSTNNYILTFDPNGGTGGGTITRPYGSVFLPITVSRVGYTQNPTTPWSPALPEPQTVPAVNTTYHAQWVANSYTITFDANGGIGFADAISQEYGSSVTLPTEGFSRTWFTFLGWNTTAGATTALTGFNTPAGDVTLYAVWERVPVALSVKAGATTIIDQSGHFIYGLAAGMKADEFEKDFVQINGDGDIVFTYQSGSFGTGTKVDVIDNVTNEVKATFYIVIFGDVNGDGNIDSIDAGTMVDVENNAVTWNPITDASFIKAGNINGDVNVDSIDAGIAVDYENNMMNIDQITGLAYQR